MVVARSLGCGACWGGLLGFLTLAVGLVVVSLVSGHPSLLGAIVFFGLFAAAVGGIVGAACGLVASVPILLVGDAERRSPNRSARARRDRVSLAAGGGAALLPAAIGAWLAARGTEYWPIAWWCVSGMAAVAGMALGPRVLYGRRVRKRPARDRVQPDRAEPDDRSAA